MEYRAYVLKPNGTIERRIDFEAEQDEAALAHAKQYVDGGDVELWTNNRMVGLLTRKGDRATESPSMPRTAS